MKKFFKWIIETANRRHANREMFLKLAANMQKLSAENELLRQDNARYDELWSATTVECLRLQNQIDEARAMLRAALKPVELTADTSLRVLVFLAVSNISSSVSPCKCDICSNS